MCTHVKKNGMGIGEDDRGENTAVVGGSCRFDSDMRCKMQESEAMIWRPSRYRPWIVDVSDRNAWTSSSCSCSSKIIDSSDSSSCVNLKGTLFRRVIGKESMVIEGITRLRDFQLVKGEWSRQNANYVPKSLRFMPHVMVAASE